LFGGVNSPINANRRATATNSSRVASLMPSMSAASVTVFGHMRLENAMPLRHASQLSAGVSARIYHSAVARRQKWYLVAGLASGIAAYLLGATLIWSLAIGALAPTVLAAAPRFLLGTIIGASTPNPAEDLAAAMSGTEFEDYIARIARSSGMPVIMTSVTGDWGVDLIVGKRPNRLAIQCKRQSRPVGSSAVQEVVAGAPMQDCSKTMVITNNEFTPAARKLAELHGCELVGSTELPRLRSTIRRLTEPSRPTEVS
jgi:restriction system protein